MQYNYSGLTVSRNMQVFLVNPDISLSFKIAQPLRIVVIGDSLVYGYGDCEGGGWVERLRRDWMAYTDGPILYNLGVRGDTVARVKQRLSQEFSCRGEIRNRFPDLILLSVGVNDTPRLGHCGGRNQTSYEQFTSHINQLLDMAMELAPVMFVGMVPVDESKMPFLGCFYFNLKDQYRYKEVCKNACEQRNIPYLDIFDLWMSRGDYWRQCRMSADGLHPNSRGYETLYRQIKDWLKTKIPACVPDNDRIKN